MKKKETEQEKTNRIVQTLIENIPNIRKIMRDENAPMSSDVTVIGKMYDFYREWGTGHEDGGTWAGLPNPGVSEIEDARKEMSPKSVLNELETIPDKLSVENLDSKIEVLKTKSRFISQRYTKSQIEGLIQRLENRRKYAEHAAFYEKFPVTTDDKIDVLLSKYKLEMNDSDMFVPSFPNEAIAVMDEYSKVTKKVTDEQCIFYVIAEEKDFKKKREKLDPILLVQSPFAFVWQILGAWDKEMLLLHEL